MVHKGKEGVVLGRVDLGAIVELDDWDLLAILILVRQRLPVLGLGL
jgi:hypothetical protein